MNMLNRPVVRPEPPDPLEERVLRRIPFEVRRLPPSWPCRGLFGPLTGLFFLGGRPFRPGLPLAEKSLTRFLAREKKGALRSGIILYALRLVLILGVFLIIILLFPKKILAFGAGFSTVILVFLGEGFVVFVPGKWKD